MEWLIEGHLTEKEALDMVMITEEAMPKFEKMDMKNYNWLQVN